MPSGVLSKVAASSKVLRFAVRYARNLNSHYWRKATLAIDGPTVYKRRIWKRYLTPDPAFQPISLSPSFKAIWRSYARTASSVSRDTSSRSPPGCAAWWMRWR